MCARERGRPVWCSGLPRSFACALTLLLGGCGGSLKEARAPAGGEGAGTESVSMVAAPRSTAYTGDGLDAALAAVSGACAEELRADFEEGRARHPECDAEGFAVARRIAPPAEAVFGVGRLWQITSYGLWMETEEAYACERWPLKRGADLALSAASAQRSGCELRPRTRPLNLVVGLDDGSKIVVEGALAAAPGGRQVWFGDLLASVGLASEGVDLRSIRRLGLGEGAWLVELDVRALFRGLTDRAVDWSMRGWATPHLFGALTSEHPFDYGAAMLGLERLMVRQERDFTAVVSGELSAERFVLRHAWSPYLIAVRRHVGVWGDGGATAAWRGEKARSDGLAP